MGLGSLDNIGLGKARDAMTEAHKLLFAGKDPIEERNAERAARRVTVAKAKTFAQCAVAYIAAHEAGWHNAKHRSKRDSS